MVNARLLRPEDLINPNRHNPVLGPNEIPVHPTVYNLPDAYNPKFVKDVSREVDKYLREDISAIEKTLNRKLGIELSKGRITQRETKLEIKEINLCSDPTKKYVEIALSSADIAPDTREGQRRTLQLDGTHPMPLDELRHYALNPSAKSEFELEIPTWYVHNYMDHGLPLMLYFRNFTIAFNNLGIKRL